MTLTVTGLDHCGNSPRMLLVGEIITAWAGYDADALAPTLAEDAVHEDAHGECHTGRDAVLRSFGVQGAQHLVIRSLRNHGRLASADGVLTLEDGAEYPFSHHFSFSSVTKTAPVTQIRSYSRELTAR